MSSMGDSNPRVMGLPSQVRARDTYVTLATTSDTIPGFEQQGEISPNKGWLTYISIAMHEAQPAGTYVLLFDFAGGMASVVNGALALQTLGPTPGPATGGSILWSEPVSEGYIVMARSGVNGRGEKCAIDPAIIKGFPFDKGCQFALSSTPGRLTLIGQAGLGARVTARYQSEGAG